MADQIIIRGARVHNLKNIDIALPRHQLIVMTGLSGSGKSSLAFDTLYAEGQRRYVESLSAYARQFLGQMEKPDVDSIEGLSPAISIDQKTTSRNPRSTVGTVTEIHDYLRLLYARAGTPHCPRCGQEITHQSLDQIVDRVSSLPERTRIYVLAPIVRGRKGEHIKLLEDMRRQGYVRARIDGEIVELDPLPSLTKTQAHTVEIVIDRLVVRPEGRLRLASSLEMAMKLAEGLVIVHIQEGEDWRFSQRYACPDCGISIEEMTPRLFSFNNPYGACPACTGLGIRLQVDPSAVWPDRSKSLREGAIQVSGWGSAEDDTAMTRAYLEGVADHYHFSLDTPVEQLSPEAQNVLLYGSKGEIVSFHCARAHRSQSFEATFEGIIPSIERRYRETSSEVMKERYQSYMTETRCPVCQGQRLRPEALAVTVGGYNLAQLSAMPIRETIAFFASLALDEKQTRIATPILREIRARLQFLMDVGLNYLTLSRGAATLSGGEAQRIRLATQIGASLVGVLYILDEPSIGLHPHDNQKLIATLQHLRDLGNTVIVVEHDEETMRAADYLVDIGPGAGVHGGAVTAAGTVAEVMANPHSLTGQYLSGARQVPIPAVRRAPTGWITVRNARAHNLKGIDAAFPLGVMTCVTGLSGSGKSSLVNEILLKSLARALNRAKTTPGPHDGIDGIEALDKVIQIDQSPIGRTPRSNPATYTGVFDLIRELFAATPTAKTWGYSRDRFSFNVRGGRCEACAGAGILKIEMHFLPDVYVPCEVCKGQRYNRETLEVTYKGKNIYEVLEMTVDEAAAFFYALPKIADRLHTLQAVGLGYIKLGQSSTTLSGGEAQRIKLAAELSRRSTGRTLYVLDEPTTGLHMADVERLLEVLTRLTELGNTLVIIEHNLDVIKSADYIIDMGPEGGDKGGRIIATGTPEQLAQTEGSYTGACLAPVLQRAGIGDR